MLVCNVKIRLQGRTGSALAHIRYGVSLQIACASPKCYPLRMRAALNLYERWERGTCDRKYIAVTDASNQSVLAYELRGSGANSEHSSGRVMTGVDS